MSSKSDVSMAADTVQGVFLKANVFLTSFQNKKNPDNSILSLIGKNNSVGC